MLWMIILGSVLAGVGLLVFFLVRDSFGVGRKTGSEASTILPAQDARDIEHLNSIMNAHTHKAAAPTPEALVTEQEQEFLAESLAEVAKNPVLPQAPQPYLRMVEPDTNIDKLLQRFLPGGARPSGSVGDFWIELTEERSLEHPPARPDTTGKKP